MLFFLFNLEKFIDAKYMFNKKQIAVLALSLGFILMLRHNGSLIYYSFLIIISILLYKHNRKSLFTYIVVALTSLILMNTCNMIFNPNHVQPKTSTVIEYKSMQLLSYYDEKGFVSDSDKEKLSTFINLGKLKEYYNLYLSDNIANNLSEIVDDSLFNKNKTEYYSYMVKLVVSHPVTYAKYIYHSSIIVWGITKDQGEIGAGMFADFSCERDITCQYGKYANNFLVKFMYVRPAIYLYGGIILTIVIICLYRSMNINKKKYYLLLLPMILNNVGISLTCPSQDIRYVYSNFLFFYFALILFVNCIYEYKHKK